MLLKSGAPLPLIQHAACTVERCSTQARRNGLCDKHSQRRRKTGKLEAAAYADMSIEERFWSKVDLTGPCWLWTGPVNNHGYGIFAIYVGRRQKYLAHRFSMRVLGLLLDESLKLLHTCDTPRCVNPEHLQPGTQGDNMRDAARKGRVRNQFGAQKNVDGLTKAERKAARA